MRMINKRFGAVRELYVAAKLLLKGNPGLLESPTGARLKAAADNLAASLSQVVAFEYDGPVTLRGAVVKLETLEKDLDDVLKDVFGIPSSYTSYYGKPDESKGPPKELSVVIMKIPPAAVDGGKK